jgi:hypothetical protein
MQRIEIAPDVFMVFFLFLQADAAKRDTLDSRQFDSLNRFPPK